MSNALAFIKEQIASHMIDAYKEQASAAIIAALCLHLAETASEMQEVINMGRTDSDLFGLIWLRRGQWKRGMSAPNTTSFSRFERDILATYTELLQSVCEHRVWLDVSYDSYGDLQSQYKCRDCGLVHEPPFLAVRADQSCTEAFVEALADEHNGYSIADLRKFNVTVSDKEGNLKKNFCMMCGCHHEVDQLMTTDEVATVETYAVGMVYGEPTNYYIETENHYATEKEAINHIKHFTGCLCVSPYNVDTASSEDWLCGIKDNNEPHYINWSIRKVKVSGKVVR